jgi:hypothetical protein
LHTGRPKIDMSDIEAASRRDLISLLGDAFICAEEVAMLHPRLGVKMRPDVVAVPTNEQFLDCAIAFEVKLPTPDWEATDWSHALRQAHSYLDAEVPGVGFPPIDKARTIRLAFIYPSPGWCVGPKRTIATSEIAGMLQLAGNLRVGHADWRRVLTKNEKPDFQLALGSTAIWTQRKGWTSWAAAHMSGATTVGSRRR